MQIREATLPEVLDNRERRVMRQRQLLEQYQKTLICFTMNIPGPMKYNEWIHAGHQLGKQQLLDMLQAARVPVIHQEEHIAVTGCESFLLVDAPADTVKKLTVQLEDSCDLGRLYDMDVISARGEKQSRERMGLPGRKCLICEQPASVCGPVRAHSAAQLWQRTEQILRTGVTQARSQHIGALAVKALLYEVGVTPKPGLVDRANAGAHRDMDIFTFFGSTAVLQPYFTQCAKIGMESQAMPATETFQKIRQAGMLAEGEMLRQTQGVNTHKGAIFSMGILCAAAGRLVGQCPLDDKKLLAECAAIAQGITQRDLQNINPQTAQTAGERLYAAHGITGIRGQAEAGFPAVMAYGLPTLRRGLELDLGIDRAGAAAMLTILAHTDDTNLIARSNRETQQAVAREISRLLEDTPYPLKETLEDLDRAFIRANLSPGGSADLLALTWLLHFLTQ